MWSSSFFLSFFSEPVHPTKCRELTNLITDSNQRKRVRLYIRHALPALTLLTSGYMQIKPVLRRIETVVLNDTQILPEISSLTDKSFKLDGAAIIPNPKFGHST